LNKPKTKVISKKLKAKTPAYFRQKHMNLDEVILFPGTYLNAEFNKEETISTKAKKSVAISMKSKSIKKDKE